ncbi:MAG: Peptide chain release factor subunit 1 [Candidatus Heimdallarchaeota archaeon LC_2]|nr:MAG: Peptide chain release factor subunit 1 [Candidatus Heimdallarchaeota archaeon LC_2]
MSEKKRSSLELYHLKKSIRKLERKKSFNLSTNLVTLYIPPGTQLSDTTALLRDELGTTTNIKDRKTGKAVADALRSILSRMQYLKNGENGLAIFSGITESAQKVEYFAIEPPEKVTIKSYICDSQFHVDHLKSMLETKDQLGIIVIDRGGASFATIKGSSLNLIDDVNSFVPGKHSRGGQSAGRIERGIEILAREFYSKMAVKANHIFLEDNPISALVVGGPAMSKDEFLEHPSLDYRLKEKIFKVYDVGYTGEIGIRELLMRAEDDLEQYALIKEKKLVQQFLGELGKDSGKAIYGEKHIRKALKASAVEIILFSDGIEKIQSKIECSKCNKQFIESTSYINQKELAVKLVDTSCPQCKSNGTLSIIEDWELIDEFEKLAIDTGAEIEVISIQHEDGQILLNSFTGIGAILRYPIDL